MIAYDLECRQGHQFEGWFENPDAFNTQLAQGLLVCPVCGATDVNRVLSTFGIARHRSAPPADGGENPADANPLEKLKKISEFIERNFEDVGSSFTQEALKMHYGVTDHRNIRGVSSSAEEDILREEGVNYFKMPVIKTNQSDEN
jgi:hypothetical protein